MKVVGPSGMKVVGPSGMKVVGPSGIKVVGFGYGPWRWYCQENSP
jgi:hypothetical protein